MKHHMLRISSLCIASSAIVLAGVLWAPPAIAATCGTNGTTWQLGNEPGSIQLLDNSNNWNGGNSCLTPGANGIDFTVQSQTANTANLNPVGYPDTNLGCEGGFCTSTARQRQPLPAVSGTVSPIVTATWTGFAGGPNTKYDLLIDSQFSADCNASDSNPVFNANVGIYLDVVNNGSHGKYTSAGVADANSGPTFTDSDGNVWYTKQVSSGGIYKTEFSAVNPVSSVSSKALAQFYAWAAQQGSGYLPAGDCLRDIGVGYEPWTALPANTVGMSGVFIDP
jgi:hypothetical protein